jgi:hypothetical protein
MKKLMLFPFLSILFINSYSQDTICTYFTGEDIYEFDYRMDSVLSYDKQTTKFYTVEVGYRQVLCLDLSDDKKRYRKIITIYPDGEKITQILDSQQEVYYWGFGPYTIQVGRPTIFKI